MAKAGSGDVLAGVITGLTAQHMNLYDSVVSGVYLHANGGDYAKKSCRRLQCTGRRFDFRNKRCTKAGRTVTFDMEE